MFEILTQKLSNTGNGVRGGELLEPISKSDIIGGSINSCIKQDEEFSELDLCFRGNPLMSEYEYRPESFEVRALSNYFPKKIKQVIINYFNDIKSRQLDIKTFNYTGESISELTSRSRILTAHSIFYIYYENEIIFWNWTKDDPIYSVQIEEFYNENTNDKAQITCVGSHEYEDSIKLLVSTKKYIILLELIKNSNGNYIINRIKDSFCSLENYKNILVSCIASHKFSGRFFLGCANTGLVLEYTNESSWFEKKVKKISRMIISNNDYNSRLVNISNSYFSSYIPNFLRTLIFGNAHNCIKSMFVDDNRGLLYVLYGNSDIDVFNIPIGNILIKKISDDFTYFERKDFSFSPSSFLFRISMKSIHEDLNKLINSNVSKKQGVNSQKNDKGLINKNGIEIHSIHPTTPQESDSIFAILVTKTGNRIYMEANYEPLLKGNVKNIQFSKNLTYLLPIGMSVSGFKKSPIDNDDSINLKINSSFYSNGVFIQSTINNNDFLNLSDSQTSRNNDQEPFSFDANLDNESLNSTIFATCNDQTVLAKNQSPIYNSNNQNFISGLNEWQYFFTDSNLGLILNMQERNLMDKYARLFEDLWNTPNPFINNNSRDFFFIRPNISKSIYDQLVSSSNGFGCRTSGSKFFHLWKYFFNKITFNNHNSLNISKDESKVQKTLHKQLKLSRPFSLIGISYPKYSQNGLKDLVLDQTTQNRSWTIITTKGIFLLEKRKLLDIITKMTLEPHNYSFMMNIFEDYENFSPNNINGLNLNNRSITFVMKLLGTFAQSITFEQFFAIIWQGLINMNAKGALDNDMIQRFYLNDIKNDNPFDVYLKNKDSMLFDNDFQQDEFPVITLIKIWLTLLSDDNIQNKSNSNCLLNINSLNYWLAVTPRCKGLLLFIGRILRSIWAIPLFQQTNFEFISQNNFNLSNLIEENQFYNFNDQDANLDSDPHDQYLNGNKNSVFVSEFIKTQLESSEVYNEYENLTQKSDKFKSSSNKGKDASIDIFSCINEFYKPEACEWLTHNFIDEKDFDNNGRNSSLIIKNNSRNFNQNDSISVTISSSLKEEHVQHLKNNLIPIINILDILLPSWFPSYSVEISRNFNEESDVQLINSTKQNPSSQSINGSNNVSNTYSSINITELQLFIEIHNFVQKVIEALDIMSLFIKTYPLGIKYNGYITDENILSISYLDILKKSIINFNLFDLIDNKGFQFIVRLLFRYNILSASQFLKNSPKNKYFLLPIHSIFIEQATSLLNKEIIHFKRKRDFNETFERKNFIQKRHLNTSNILNKSSNIKSLFLEYNYDVPLNIILDLLCKLKEYHLIVNLIISQSEYIHCTGLYPLWLTNGERVEINVPNSVSEFSSYISDSNYFTKYFLNLLLNEINACGQQYNRLMPFSDIILNFEQTNCKTLLEYCKLNPISNTTRSIYTYEFHCTLWIYQNFQYTLDQIYNEYILEIERLISKIDLIDDLSFEYLRDLEISINNHAENKDTANLQENISKFNLIKHKIMNLRSSITNFILYTLKYNTENNSRISRQNQKIFYKIEEWLHYYMFSYISYNETCMKKTIYDELKIRRNNRLENWLTRNLCITVFQFSENSIYLKNWLENYHLNDFYNSDHVENYKPDNINNEFKNTNDKTNYSNRLKNSNVNKDNKVIPSDPEKEITNFIEQKDLRNDQGYLLYSARQYLSAGNYYYTKSKLIWKIPSGIDNYLKNVNLFDNFIKQKTATIDIDQSKIKLFDEYLKRNFESYKKKIINTSLLGGTNRLENILDLFNDIYRQLLNMQQEPTLINRRSLLLQSQTCIERDMNEEKNKELIGNIRNDIFNIDTQINILLNIIEYINYYIISAIQQNVNINPLVKKIFELFKISVEKNTSFDLNLNRNSNSITKEFSLLIEHENISQEGIDVFKTFIMGLFHIQSMIYSNETLFEFIVKLYNLTGFSSITEIKWLIENNYQHIEIYNLICNKISSLCEFRTKQAFYFETPILFETDVVSLLHFCENSIPYNLNINKHFKNSTYSKISNQQFDSIIEIILIELHKFSSSYYFKFKESDLVDIYNLEQVDQVKSRVLWWVWPIKFMLFHLNNKSLLSRLLPIFSGNSHNSNLLSNFINNHERVEISEIIRANIM